MFGGDEVSALVLDIGSASVKGGFAGDDTPKAIFPSVIGFQPGADGADGTVGAAPAAVGDEADVEMSESTGAKGSEYHVGTQAMLYRRDNVEAKSTFSNGLVADWDAFEQLLLHAYTSGLRAKSEEHPLLITEPAHTTKAQRLKLCELVFEKLNPPAVFVAKTPVLTAFASGRTNATVVDCGASHVTVSTVHEGFSLTKTVQKSPVGGDALDRLVLNQLAEMGTQVRPRYEVKRKMVDDKLQVSFTDMPNTSTSYREYCQREIARELRESTCCVKQFVDSVATPSMDCYDIPQGSVYGYESKRFHPAEVLFDSNAIQAQERHAMGVLPDAQVRGMSELLTSCISASDVDLRRELYSNIILSGGLSLLPGTQQRLQADVSLRLPHGHKLKIIAPAASERRFSAWIGGSILGSLGSFHQIWMSKAEYEEHGAKIIERKCP